MLNARSQLPGLSAGPKLVAFARCDERRFVCTSARLASQSPIRERLSTASPFCRSLVRHLLGSHPAPGGARVFCFGFAALAGLGTSLKGTRQECKHLTLGAGTTRMALPSVP
jgi:hypothetical protein